MESKIKAACYIRVSTDEQTEYSLDAQLRAIREFCARNNFELSAEHIYCDDGVSGRQTRRRAAFLRMIAAAKSPEKPFGVVVVHKFDRFARSREDSVVYKSLLRKECGIRVLSVSESVEDDKFGLILEAMLEAMAEFYSLNLADEVKKGMAEKALRGEPLTCPPLGYCMENKQLSPVPNEAIIVQRIFEDFLRGDSLGAIARRLNSEGIRTRRGSRFESRAIGYILRNPVYTGKIRWNSGNTETLVINGSHLPIIDESQFERVQARLKEQAERYPHRSKATASTHWLVGLIKCAACKTGLVKNGIKYFQCRAYSGGKCTVSHLIPISDAENAVIGKLIEDADFSEPFIVMPACESTLQEHRQTDALRRRLGRIKDAYLDGAIDLNEFKSEKIKIERRLESAENIKSITPFPVGLRYAAEILRSNAPPEHKKSLASDLIYAVIFDKQNATVQIIYNLPE